MPQVSRATAPEKLRKAPAFEASVLDLSGAVELPRRGRDLPNNMNHFRLNPLMAALALLPTVSFAQGIATEAQLTPVNVTETRAQLDPNLPNSNASKTARDLEEQNIFNPEDALQYLPSTTVRKRYFGDRNANLGGRSFGTLEPGRALVYLDGYLISSFLGRYDAPRWNMINNENIERVDVLYGPFSAIYPGNSVGTTAVITERKPQGFEASASLKYNQQSFKEYGSNDTYGGTMSSARLTASNWSNSSTSVGFFLRAAPLGPLGTRSTKCGILDAPRAWRIAPSLAQMVIG